jgi:hypothetical protein
MRIRLEKFGTLLVSRQNGREAFAAPQSQVAALGENENLELDFGGISTFSPSWGDEFLSPLVKKYDSRLMPKHTKNLSVKATPELLEEINKQKFNRSE